MSSTTYSRFKFFRENAGWSTPPGKAQCALQLARAEEVARVEDELRQAIGDALDAETLQLA